jgi:hypothetical protein
VANLTVIGGLKAASFDERETGEVLIPASQAGCNYRKDYMPPMRESRSHPEIK